LRGRYVILLIQTNVVGVYIEEKKEGKGMNVSPNEFKSVPK
jgi:hypothetical protein